MKSANRLAAFLAACLSLSCARACLNQYFEPATKTPASRGEFENPGLTYMQRWRPHDPEPKPQPVREVLSLIDHPTSLVDWSARERSLWGSARDENASYKVRSDYAVALLHLGRTREAIEILEPLAAKYPKEYRIQANLGTAYELDGKLDQAVAYIKKAVEIKPASHEGTEWLHVKILEAKIALAKDPGWLKGHSVLGYDTGPNHSSQIQALVKNSAALKRVSNALVYQLRERLQFVRPPDPTVADLLYDMGSIYSRAGLPIVTEKLYAGSLKFGDLRKTEIRSTPVIMSPNPGAVTTTSAR